MGKATKALEFDIFFGGSKIAFLSHFNTKKCYFYLWTAKKTNAIKLQDFCRGMKPKNIFERRMNRRMNRRVEVSFRKTSLI